MAPIINVTGETLQALDILGVKYNLPEPKVQNTPVMLALKGEAYVLLDKEHQKGDYSQVGLLIPFQKTHLNERWNDCNTPKLLAEESGYMPTIRAQVDFLRLLKSGKAFDGNGKKIDSEKLRALYDEITATRGSWRSEWLDAQFGNRTMTYHAIEKDGSIKPRTVEIKKSSMKDRTPGIDLDPWLETADELGLPTSRTKNGKLYYWSPRQEAVAGFGAYSVRAVLVCDRFPSGRGSSLGVRVVRAKI